MKYKFHKFLVSLQVSITGIIIITAGVVAATTQVPWVVFSSNKSKDLVDQISGEIIDSVASETESLFARAITLQNSVSDFFSSGVVDIFDKRQREDMYISLLWNHQDFSWISFGWSDGDFFGAQRGSDNQIHFYERDWSPTNQETREIVRTYNLSDNDPPTLVSSQQNTTTYNATQRGWYRNALGTDQDIVTSVYIFSASRNPGINVARRLVSPDGELIGVVSIAMELSSISNFIRDLNISDNGVAFIVDSEQRLVAFRDTAELTYINNEGGLSLTNLSDTSHRSLQIAADAIEAQRMETSEIGSQVHLSHSAADQDYLVSLSPLQGNEITSALDWFVGIVIPTRDFLGDIRLTTLFLALGVIIVTVVFLVGILLFTKRAIVVPVGKIAEQARYIKTLDLEQVELPHSPIREIYSLSDSMNRMTNGLASFRKYVPTELVQLLILQGQEARLGGEYRDMTIFFSDIARFTQLSEILGTKLAQYLMEYFSGLSDLIAREGGVIDKYIGDAIMAFWGAPLPQQDHHERACRAALRCQRHLYKLRGNAQLRGNQMLYCRIGINSGKVLVGNFGGDRRMDYTVLGDPVNVASRLESLNKQYGTNIMIGKETYEHVKDIMICRKLDRVRLYGKTESEEVYELLAARSGENEDKYKWIAHYEMGFEYYLRAEWVNAIKEFREAYRLRNNKDAPSVKFVKRCKLLATEGVPDNWGGIFTVSSK